MTRRPNGSVPWLRSRKTRGPCDWPFSILEGLLGDVGKQGGILRRIEVQFEELEAWTLKCLPQLEGQKGTRG